MGHGNDHLGVTFLQYLVVCSSILAFSLGLDLSTFQSLHVMFVRRNGKFGS
jgi:hypothetical protein